MYLKDGDKMYKYYKKYEEIINYLIMGTLTTVVSLLSYAIFNNIFKNFVSEMVSINIATVISWILAVTFAYVTNKKYVFKTNTNQKETIKEFIKFYEYRILSLVIDIFFMWFFVKIINMNDMAAKIINQFIITAANYVFSKLFVFNKN